MGVDTVVLAVNYRPEVMSELLKPWEEKLGVKIEYSREEEPLGTGEYLFYVRPHSLSSWTSCPSTRISHR